MAHLIDKDALLAEINKRIIDAPINNIGHQRVWAYNDVKDIIDTLEVKEINFDKEYKEYVEEDPVYNKLVNGIVGKAIAKYFFELGMRVNNPITAADRGTAGEIIINLKRVEQDYRINLTKEIEWVRNQVKKGEEV